MINIFDVVALGELLIDFTPTGNSSANNLLFERNPGGAPANVLTAVSKLGGKCAFIGKVGNDQFGNFLKSVLEDNHIEAKGLKFSEKVNTTLAFVHLDEHGDRSFSFYRNPGADLMLTPDDLELDIIKECKIFHFGSLSMTDEPARSATIKAVEYAKSEGKIISYDPNWRPLLWKDDIQARAGMMLGLEYADILKISETELEFLTGESNLEYGSKILFNKGIKLILVTLGPKGCFFRCSDGCGHLNTYDTRVVDTTGAGDAFLGGLLYQISKVTSPLVEINKTMISDIIDFSNAVGALCASKRGAIPAMPSLPEVEACINKIRKVN
ncbi:carbohydrate kinase [Clostridium sp. BNL1100]|uniref:carbohydrate kinase family protein n=1 Tax=Clostridium sp. BNL1100 TaxID=755731 RepID=UPI00024A72E4|nr:carbohydrate kinase [Clostridium sp. BNL1100]AEY67229.1 sugar kinase, ribokinase [Clostridium sp. BNL1100]